MLILFSSAIISLTGCADSTPQSMTEGVPMSDIEAYEQAVQAMEAEDAGEMDIDENKRVFAALAEEKLYFSSHPVYSTMP